LNRFATVNVVMHTPIAADPDAPWRQ
jgi:hypothetical protein